jgi:hypothetical protein
VQPAPKVYKGQPVLMVRMALKDRKDLRVVTEQMVLMAQLDLKAYKVLPVPMVATEPRGLKDLKDLKDQRVLRFSIQILQVNNSPR